VDGKLYDGVTAHPHDVRVKAADGRIELSQATGWSDSVEGNLLKRMDAPAAAFACLQDRHPLAGARKLAPRHQASRAGADDDDVLGCVRHAGALPDEALRIVLDQVPQQQHTAAKLARALQRHRGEGRALVAV